MRCVTPIFEEIYSAYYHASMKNSAFLMLGKVRKICCPPLFYWLSSKVACSETVCPRLHFQRWFSKHVLEIQREHLKYHLARTQFPNKVSELGITSLLSPLNHFLETYVIFFNSKCMTAKKFSYSKTINHRLWVTQSKGNQFRNFWKCGCLVKLYKRVFFSLFFPGKLFTEYKKSFTRNVNIQEHIVKSQTIDLNKCI